MTQLVCRVATHINNPYSAIFRMGPTRQPKVADGQAPQVCPWVPARSVSVVINTYNRVGTLPHTLDAFGYQTYFDFEVIVVNGPSDDGTAAFLAHYPGRIRVAVCRERNLGQSRNIGVALAAGDIVAFIDDDAVPSPTWIEKLVEVYRNSSVAAAGGPVFNERGDTPEAQICTCTRFGKSNVDAVPPTSAYVGKNADPFLYLAGSNMSFRRHALIVAGGFNENLNYGYDDVEICRRTIDAGYDVAFVDGAPVYHSRAANYVRDSEGVIRDIYPFLRAQAIFALQDESGTILQSEIIERLNQAAAYWCRTAEDNFAQKIYTSTERDAFICGVHRALEDGIKVGLGKRPIRTFDAPALQAFRQFRKFPG